jgi:septum formation protein
MRLVLASTSPYRRSLLERLEVPFHTAAPAFDESTTRDRFGRTDDETYALDVARSKARSLVDAHPDAFILAADQIAVLPGPPRRLLEKPGTEENAIDQLVDLAGRMHRLVTGVVLLSPGGERERTAIDVHRLTLRTLDRAEIEAYVRRHRPVDCVGAYRIEDAGIKLFARVEGDDHTGIVGLPLIAVCSLMRDAGLL